jgi:hypothetical protein
MAMGLFLFKLTGRQTIITIKFKLKRKENYHVN